MRATFLNKDHQSEFETRGYVEVKGFLSSSDITDLLSFYERNKESGKQGFHATMHSTDVEFRRKTTNKIASVFRTKAERLIDNYRPTVGNYTVKEPDQISDFEFHLDWNMVDESISKSVTIWVPLQDTNAKNGNLWVLEGSHKLGNSYRCGPGLTLLTEDLEEIKKARFKCNVLPMKAGDAIIYDHKLYHGSPVNQSDKARIAINLAWLPKEQKAMHYFREENKVVAYEIPDDFYHKCLTHEAMDMVGYAKVKTLDLVLNKVEQNIVNQMSN